MCVFDSSACGSLQIFFVQQAGTKGTGADEIVAYDAVLQKNGQVELSFRLDVQKHGACFAQAAVGGTQRMNIGLSGRVGVEVFAKKKDALLFMIGLPPGTNGDALDTGRAAYLEKILTIFREQSQFPSAEELRCLQGGATMKVVASPNKLPHLNFNQVGAVKDFLGIALDEDLPPTKPVLCILYIVGVLCNGTATMHRFAATARMDLKTSNV